MSVTNPDQDVTEPAFSLYEAMKQSGRAIVRPWLRRVKERTIAKLNDFRGTVRTADQIQETLREQWRRVLKQSNIRLDKLPPPTGPRILFALAHGWGGARMCFETVLAASLRLRGAEVWTLQCDKALPACEFNENGNHTAAVPSPGYPKLPAFAMLERCRVCTDHINGPFEFFGMPTVAFSELMRPDDLQRAISLVEPLSFDELGRFEHNGVRVGEHARASVFRTLLIGTLPQTNRVERLFRRFLISTILTEELTERALDIVKPDRLLAVHGVYATHGTICEVARKKGVDIVVHGLPYRKGTVWLSRDDTYHRTLVTEPTSLWENIELTPGMAAKVDEYLASKRLGGKDYVAYHADSINDREKIVTDLGLDPNKPIVSLFTNVLWDAQLYYEYNVFSDMLEWLYETIRYFGKREDIQLVIRLHPAEARGAMPTKQPLAAEIAREFPSLPSNVHVIAPESRISSYTLAEMSCAALIYGARMGVEVAILGTPLIIAGETFNRRKGYSYDAETREQYYSLLDGVTELPRNSPAMIERARKYAYHFLYRLMIDFPLVSVSDGVHLSDPRIEFDRLEDLLPGQSPPLDAICRGLMEAETPFLFEAR